MSTVLPGQTFTFNVLFYDTAGGSGFEVNNPTINAARYSAGAKIPVIVAEPMTAVVGDLGRYVFEWVVPNDAPLGETIFAEMTGEDPLTGDTLLIEQTVEVGSAAGAGSNQQSGLRARFIK